MATIEGIGGNIEAGKYRDAREAVAMFLVREIYMERVDAALRFICEVPSCQNTPVSLGSAPPAVEYFFEQQF